MVLCEDMRYTNVIFYFLLLVSLVLVSTPAGANAHKYIKEICDYCSEHSSYATADECYDYALTYPFDGPIISRIWVIPQYGYFIYANEENNNLNRFTRILSEPISKSEGVPSGEFRDISFIFSITNPNDMQMKIEDIYVEVLEYYPIKDVNFEPILMGGEYLDYFCNIKPELGLYKSIPLFNDVDYIKLDPGELESFNISVNTIHQGVYRLGICVEYTIGGRTELIDVRNPIPDCISFVDGRLENYISDEFMPDNIKYKRLNVLVGFFDRRTATENPY